MKRSLSRKHVLRGFGTVAGLALGAPVRAAEPYTMRLGVSVAAATVGGQAAVRFASSVGRRSNGQLKVDVYPNGQLAAQQETTDVLRSGVQDFAIIASSFLNQLVPNYQIFDVPFLFKNLGAVYRVLDGPIGAELFSDLDANGLVGVSWYIDGFKQLETTSKAITTPDDLKGLRIRIQGSAVQAAMCQALGAIPVPINVAELYTALAQHAVDGMDNPLDVVAAGKYYTVIKHIAMANHVVSASLLLGSKRKIDALPTPLQKIIHEEGRALDLFLRTSFTQQVAADTKTLKENGVAFTEVQYSAFRKAVDPVYAMVQSKLGGTLLERVGRVS